MKELMWAYLIHLGENMWNDREDISDTHWGTWEDSPKFRNHLICEDDIWDSVVEKLPQFGINTLVIDVGDGVKFDSHPELAIKGSWDKSKLEEKLSFARSIGLKVIPKLNFSACHDAWLKEYQKMLSTSTYYRVVQDVISETCEMFDGPEFFHLGMDEETWEHQREFTYATIRMRDLWWDDLYFYSDLCEKLGARPWVWSDKYWHHPDEFAEKMPRDILQSNWEYGGNYKQNQDSSFQNHMVDAFAALDKLGFEQVPTGSNWSCRQNMELQVEACQQCISPDNLAGYMMAPWSLTTKRQYYYLLDGAARLGEAKRRFYK